MAASHFVRVKNHSVREKSRCVESLQNQCKFTLLATFNAYTPSLHLMQMPECITFTSFALCVVESCPEEGPIFAVRGLDGSPVEAGTNSTYWHSTHGAVLKIARLSAKFLLSTRLDNQPNLFVTVVYFMFAIFLCVESWNSCPRWRWRLWTPSKERQTQWIQQSTTITQWLWHTSTILCIECVSFAAFGSDLHHFQQISPVRELTGGKRTDWFFTSTGIWT